MAYTQHPKFASDLVDVSQYEYDYRVVSIPQDEGEFLASTITAYGYEKTIEIGCAYGISSLYICDALAQTSEAQHTIIDPEQDTRWHNVGRQNLERCGFNFSRFIEKPSEVALPELLTNQETFDFAFIDGWHTFDHCLLDFFYLNRLVRVGGMIVFDDAHYPGLSRVVNYVKNYPNYRLISPTTQLTGQKTKQKLFHAGVKTLLLGSKILPEHVRRRIFLSSLNNANNTIITQRWAAVQKIAEDSRSWDWYVDF